MPNKSYLNFGDELDDQEPYSSVSDREPLESLGLDSESDPGVDLGDETEDDIVDSLPSNAAAPIPPSSPREAVAAAIAKRRAPVGSNPVLDDPLMKSFNDDQKELNSLRDTKIRADFIGNLGQSFSQLAQGSNTPKPNQNLYASLGNQNDSMIDAGQKMIDRKSRVMQAIQARRSQEAIAANRAQTQKQIHDDNVDLRRTLAQNAQGSRQERVQAKADKETTDRFDRLNSKLNADLASGRTVFGTAARTKQSVENAEALLNGEVDPNNLDSRQVYELSKVLDRILSQGSPSISGTEHLSPDTARQWLAKKLEYVTNERQGAQAGNFVKSISHTLEREKAIANKQIKDAQKRLVSSYGDLASKDQDKWNEIMEAHGLSELPSADASQAQSPSPRSPSSNSKAGQLVKVKGKMYRVGADGDTLEEVM
jgi:hypothetical protein